MYGGGGAEKDQEEEIDKQAEKSVNGNREF